MRRLALALALLAAPAQAEITPRPGEGDPHLQSVGYDPAEVVALHVTAGFALTVQFAPDERIETVTVGDPGLWTVQANNGINTANVRITLSLEFRPPDVSMRRDIWRRHIPNSPALRHTIADGDVAELAASHASVLASAPPRLAAALFHPDAVALDAVYASRKAQSAEAESMAASVREKWTASHGRSRSWWGQQRGAGTT